MIDIYYNVKAQQKKSVMPSKILPPSIARIAV
jgi:hypothetical protein